MLATIAFLAAVAGSAQAANIPDEVMVRFRAGADAAAVRRALDGEGMREADSIPAMRLRLVKLPPGLPVKRALERLRKHPLVEGASPNMAVHAAALPNDPKLNLQWALDRISATRCWTENIAGCQGSDAVTIAIIDTGIDLGHPEFAGKLVAGTNIVNPGFPADDDNGHGTLVAGLAAAATDDATGIAGVAWRAKLMPVKVLDSKGDGSEFKTIKGLEWAVANGAHVVNMSIGSCNDSGECAPGSDEGALAMDRAWSAGAVLVAAAGNAGVSEASYPAAYAYVLGVSATDRNDKLASYSNRGFYIDVAAPGGGDSPYCNDPPNNVYGTYRSSYDCDSGGPFPAGYITMHGTSLSCPMVAGLAAVLLGQNLNRSNNEVASLIMGTADPQEGSGWNEKYGFGRVNMYRALTGDMNPQPAQEKLVAYAYPNPFSPERDRVVRFTVQGQAGKPLDLEIRDVPGNLLWSRHLTDSEAGSLDLYLSSQLTWDGRDSRGRKVPNGVYFAVLKNGKSRVVMKVAVVR